jgi:hypothetical protein
LGAGGKAAKKGVFKKFSAVLQSFFGCFFVQFLACFLPDFRAFFA